MYKKAITEKRLNEKGKLEEVIVVVDMPEEEYLALVANLPSKDEDMRVERDILLQECDWTQGEDIPEKIKAPYKQYRQSLRDLPEHPNWPDLQEEDWPIKPEI